MGGWVLDCTRLMLISTQVEVVVEVGVELGKIMNKSKICHEQVENKSRASNKS